MSPRERVHRAIRAVLSLYPLRLGAALVNRGLDRFFESPDAHWMHAPGRGAWPTMVLNVSTNLQRKFFYFPRTYGRFYGGNNFARFVDATLRPGDTFVDIGSNVGFFALRAARIVGPRGRAFAFEPEPDICEALRRSAEANGFEHLRGFQLALSDRDAQLDFYRAKDGTASSLVPEVPGRERRYERTLTTRVTTLDRLVDEGALELGRVSLVKVDVEGEEARTVGGMLRSLVAAGHPPVWCEVRGPHGSTRAPNTYPAVRDLLATIGYRPLAWADGQRRPIVDADVLGRADVLFERA